MTETRWLDDVERAFWWRFVVARSSVIADVEAALKADAGIGFEDYEVLVHLSAAADHRLLMSDLAKHMVHSRNRVTQRIDRMVARGLVRREQCPDDGRCAFAVMTDEGFALIESAAPDHVRAVREHLIDRLEPDHLRSGIEIFDRILPPWATSDPPPAG
ncbi:MAG: hypothetical protein MAG471_01852 [Acidimicrobiaceae bacterium]|nr:hypothetical protein [Acidimicrobiaceae bacterium]